MTAPVAAGANRRVGVTGMAVMGQNLARNIARHGFPVAVHNRTSAKVDEFLSRDGDEGGLVGFHEIADFVAALDRPRWSSSLGEALPGWRHVVARCVDAGVAVPALGSALSWFDGYRTLRSPANLIQAQRDLFGALTHRRTDREGSFHTEWSPPSERR